MVHIPERAAVATYVSIIQQALTPVYQDAYVAQEHAWWLISHITSMSRAELLTPKELALTPQQQNTLSEALHALVEEQMPLAYLIGTVPFLNLTLHVRAPILIPRPETEHWVAALIERLAPFHHTPLRILDLCTGTGCIALALAQAFPHATIDAVDINPDALALAQENAILNKVSSVRWITQDIRYAITQWGRYDLITANPPYLSEEEWLDSDPSVKDWEDMDALISDNDGYALITTISQAATQMLNPASDRSPGQLWIEYSPDQVDRVRELLHHDGFTTIESFQDATGRERVTCATKSTL